MDLIKTVDNFLEKEVHERVFNQCLVSPFLYGERDNPNTPPTGMVCNLPVSEEMHKVFSSRIPEFFPEMLDRKLYRAYINCFSPSENPYFHKDGPAGQVTFIYYPNLFWNVNDGGETQILIDDQIMGVLPIPNRIVKFDAGLLHKATPFRNIHRFTVAIKYT